MILLTDPRKDKYVFTLGGENDIFGETELSFQCFFVWSAVYMRVLFVLYGKLFFSTLKLLNPM